MQENNKFELLLLDGCCRLKPIDWCCSSKGATSRSSAPVQFCCCFFVFFLCVQIPAKTQAHVRTLTPTCLDPHARSHSWELLLAQRNYAWRPVLIFRFVYWTLRISQKCSNPLYSVLSTLNHLEYMQKAHWGTQKKPIKITYRYFEIDVNKFLYTVIPLHNKKKLHTH